MGSLDQTHVARKAQSETLITAQSPVECDLMLDHMLQMLIFFPDLEQQHPRHGVLYSLSTRHSLKVVPSSTAMRLQLHIVCLSSCRKA